MIEKFANLLKEPKQRPSKILLKAIDKVEERAKISVREHVGFGVIAPAALGYIKDDEVVYVGEMNAENNRHGRGIYTFPDGTINIGYWNNDEPAPGNYIYIFSDGDVKVGENYEKDGRMLERGTRYRTNGTSYKYAD